MPAEKTDRKQPGRPFKKGQSGNPAGKPKGARHKATRAVEALLEGEAEALTRKAVEKALEGDTMALRLCLERLCPPRKDRPLEPIKLPKLTPGNLSETSATIIRAVASGHLAPSEGESLGKLLEGHRRAIELQELEERLAKLETEIHRSNR